MYRLILWKVDFGNSNTFQRGSEQSLGDNLESYLEVSHYNMLLIKNASVKADVTCE